jgi:DNA-binding MarR family transcriptional regulator
MDIITRDDGLLTEQGAQELAAWYDPSGADQETFEAHMMMLNAYMSLVSSAQRGRRTGMSRERYNLLRALYQAPEHRLLFREMGRSLGVSPTSITKLVDGLSRQHLVRRVTSPEDKRRMWCELTPRGVASVEERLPIVIESTKRRWAGLTRAEKRQLVHLLSKVVLSAGSAAQEMENASIDGARSVSPHAIV